MRVERIDFTNLLNTETEKRDISKSDIAKLNSMNDLLSKMQKSNIK